MKTDTRIVHSGRDPEAQFGAVNPPVYHASTILFPSIAAYNDSRKDRFKRGRSYGRHGTPTHFALEDALAAVEGGTRCLLVGSGLMAVTTALLAYLKAGDHLLMVDTVYGPARRFCDTMLAGFGVETTYYDPLIGDNIAGLMRPNTKAVYVESPGSNTFEVQDVPAIAAAAHARGAKVLMDNTWGVLNFQPFAHGVDVSIQAATKYVVGHSDAMLGAITVNADADWVAVKTAGTNLGTNAAPDDVYLGLRGLRTLSVRLRRHMRTGLRLAEWLKGRPEVLKVMHPALPGDPGHALWRRDFAGACGLFGLMLKPCPEEAVTAFIDGLELYGLGASWGGFESLLIPMKSDIKRTATRLDARGPGLRIHAGLEDPDDLIADLEAGFRRLDARR